MIRTPIFWLSIKRPLAFPSFWAWRDSLFPSTWPPVSTSLWRVTVEVWLIRIVEKCELSWTPSTNRKLTMQLKICLGNRTDKKCWHIIRLTDCLNNCFVPNYIKVPSQMCVCVCDVCAQLPVPPVPQDEARLGEFRSKKTGGFAFYWGLELNSQSNFQIHN